VPRYGVAIWAFIDRMIGPGDVNGVLALPISDYEQRQVCLLDRSQDRRRAMSNFGGKSGVSYSN